LLVTALLLVAMSLALRRWNVIPGALLAFAISFKITPVVFLVYFALKRRWKLVMTTIGLLIALNLAPAIYLGFHRNAELIGTWYQHVFVDQEFHEINGPINLSLKGQLVRLLTRVDYSRRLDGDTQYPAVNLADYSYRDINKLWLPLDVLVLALGLGFVLWPRRTQNRRRDSYHAAGFPAQPVEWETERESEAMDACTIKELIEGSTASDRGAGRATLEIGIVLCLMLLVEPLTSKIYFVALIWPLAVLLDLIFTIPERVPKPIRRTAIAVVIMNVVLPLLPGRSVQRFLLVLGVDFYLTCLVLAMLVWASLPVRRRPPQHHRPWRPSP
jgi:hypothetical protein